MNDLMADDEGVTDDERDNEILKHRLVGVSVRRIARRFGISTHEVDAALERTLTQIDNPMRLKAIKLELERLDQLTRPFFAAALAGDCASASIMIKLAERRTALLGLDAPLKIDAQRVDASGHAPTSTEEMEAAIDRLVGKKTPPESPDKPN